MRFRIKVILGAVILIMVFSGSAFSTSAWVLDGGSVNFDNSRPAHWPSIGLVNGTPYVAWTESNAAFVDDLFVKSYNGANWNLAGAGCLNTNPSQFIAKKGFATSAQFAYLAWLENNIVYVRRFNGSGWTSMGSPQPTGGGYTEAYISLSGNTPYLTYCENNGTYYYTWEKRFNGSDWQADDGILSTIPGSTLFSRVLVHNATPYVAVFEGNNSLYLKQYNVINWLQCGSVINVNSTMLEPDYDLASSGDSIYVSWCEGPLGQNKLYVKKWDGTQWASIGPGPLNYNSSLSAENPGLKMNGPVPYVIWDEDNGSHNTVHLKHFNGSAWEADPDPVATPGNATRESSLTIANNTVYASWIENGKAYVGHLAVSTPVPTTTPTTSPTCTPTSTISPTLSVTPTLTTTGTPVLTASSTATTVWTATPSSTRTPASTATHTRTPSTLSATATRTTVIQGPTAVVTPGATDVFTLHSSVVRTSRGETVRVSLNLPRPAEVELNAYNLTGQKAATLFKGSLPSGSREIQWDPGKLGSGTYYLYLDLDGQRTRKKVTIVR